MPSVGGTAVVNTSIQGLWNVAVAGYALVRCRVAGVTSGTITVTGLGTTAST